MIDQMQRYVQVSATPQRIISLVPSISELLFYLNLEERIAGITRYCIHPQEKVKSYPRIGGTKKFRFDVIAELQPDLIIGNKEENYETGISRLARDYPVWMSDIVTLNDALEMISAVGLLTDTAAEAATLRRQIEARFSAIPVLPDIPAAYIIWKNPYMAVGGKTFIDTMMTACGFKNIFSTKDRYPEITQEDLDAAEVILLSSEPYPFANEGHRPAQQVPAG